MNATFNDEARVLWIRTVLAMAGTDPQRRAFIDGYNQAPCPPFSSEQMREAHALGGKVTALLNPARLQESEVRS